MALKWTDVLDIAIELNDAHPDVDPRYVNFLKLRNWVVKVLEAIQAAWIEESA